MLVPEVNEANMNETINAINLLSKFSRKKEEHKGSAGKVLIIGGAVGMSGAVILSGRAALYSGAGVVLVGMLSGECLPGLLEQPELMLRPIETLVLEEIHPDVIVVGPGMGQSEVAVEWLKRVLAMPVPLVIDADALNMIAHDSIILDRLITRTAPSVLTPHPGEAGRLLNLSIDQIQADRLSAIYSLVALSKSIVVLKGAGTLVASLEESPQLCQEGNAGMASGGMGDTLTGIIAALIAQGVRHDVSVWDAVRLGVQLHSLAADNLVKKGVGPIGLTASEVMSEVRFLINHESEIKLD